MKYYRRSVSVSSGKRMQEKQAAVVFLEIFAIVFIFGILAGVALPYVGQMIEKSKDNARGEELQNIQAAVTKMLADSSNGSLVPVGPTADMSQVRTTDSPPLVLSDYLPAQKSLSRKLGCTYIISPDGSVGQVLP